MISIDLKKPSSLISFVDVGTARLYFLISERIFLRSTHGWHHISASHSAKQCPSPHTQDTDNTSFLMSQLLEKPHSLKVMKYLIKDKKYCNAQVKSQGSGRNTEQEFTHESIVCHCPCPWRIANQLSLWTRPADRTPEESHLRLAMHL